MELERKLRERTQVELQKERDTKIEVEKEKSENYENELSEERSRIGEALAELKAGHEKAKEMNKKLEEHMEKLSKVSNKLQEEKDSRESMMKEVEEARVLSEERHITQLAENAKIGDDLELSRKEKDTISLELAQNRESLQKIEDL